MTIGLYARISEDVAGLALGVARQEADCRTLARLRGWDVAGVYADNDLSAFKTTVVRPEFERLLEDLAAGVVDGIVAYDLDRFARQPVDLERAIRLYDSRPMVFATVQGDIDLSSPDGRTMARVMVAFANKASMDTSRRVKRKHLELAQLGKPVGGYRPFGFEPDKRTINPVEAEMIRQAARDVLAGVGLHTVVRQWNAQGVRTTAGHLWVKQVLKTMLLSPRMAGYRVYRKGIAKDAEGNPVNCVPPLLDKDVWEAVCAVLRDPARSGPHVHTGGRKYLLSGIVRCSLCSTLMGGNADRKRHTFSYACKNIATCGRVAISGPQMDALITELILRYLAEREVTTETAPWSGEAELQQVSSRVQELMAAYSEGDLSSDVVFPAVSKLEDRFKRLRADRTEWLRHSNTIATRPTNAAEAWPNLDTDQRRAVIQSVLHAVVIKRSASRGGRFDPSRADPVWR
ncbi:MAG: recombinase family protein [Actinomycetota bacterium]|nr:recombinase family protein [Actinomycetota bacterium]